MALVLHLPLIAVFEHTATHEGVTDHKNMRKVSRAFMRKRPVPKPVEAPETPEEPKGQIVTLPEPDVEVTPPKDAKYLSQHNTRVKEEMKARPQRRSKKSRMGAPAPKVSKIQSKRSRSIDETTTSQPKTKRELAADSQQKARKNRGDLAKRTKVFRSAKSRALLPSIDKQATLANLQTLTGAAASDDALLDVKKEGATTLLNSRKFQHWSYFDTIKQRVRKHWNPQNAHRRADPTGKIYGVKDRLTILRVTLNQKGTIMQLSTVKNSGMRPLDHEAQRALNIAGPFPNPPQGLIDKKGRIDFQFGFFFEITTSRFKFFRVPH